MNIVTRNESETSINKILNLVSANVSGKDEQNLLTNMYSITLENLKNDVGNDKLWFATQLKLGNLYFEMKDFKKLSDLIDELKKMV